MTDKIQNSDQKDFLYGIEDEVYHNEKGEVDFVWKEKPLKPG